jgi:hypothetical protein
MSIYFDNKGKKHLKVDISLGASKSLCVKYYADTADLLKFYLHNSPFIVYILEYMKHIPFMVDYELADDDIKGKTIEHYKHTYIDIGYFEPPPIKITNEQFLTHLNIITDNFEMDKMTSDNIFRVIRKEQSLTTISFGGFLLNVNYFIDRGIDLPPINICIQLNEENKLFTDKFNVLVSEGNNYYDFKNLPILYTKNYIENLYYSINFARKIFDENIQHLHPWFLDIIKKLYPKFYEARGINEFFNQQKNKLFITKRGVLEEDIDIKTKPFIINIPPELDNAFFEVSKFVFSYKSKTYYSKYTVKITINLRK